MPATTGPSHGRQSLSQLLAVRINARNGANALQWAIPLAICERKGTGGFVRRNFRASPGLIRHGDPARIPENPWFCPIFAVSAHLNDGDGGQPDPAVIARTLAA